MYISASSLPMLPKRQNFRSVASCDIQLSALKTVREAHTERVGFIVFNVRFEFNDDIFSFESWDALMNRQISTESHGAGRSRKDTSESAREKLPLSRQEKKRTASEEPRKSTRGSVPVNKLKINGVLI
jgi:hypothetical protein